jgi:hypothetical protein
MENTETRKLRENLTEAQKAEALRIGDLTYASERNPFKTYGIFKFIPSRTQH